MNVIIYTYIIGIIIGCIIEIVLNFRHTKIRADINSRLARNDFDRDALNRITVFINRLHIFIQDQPSYNSTISQAIKNYLQTQYYQLENHSITKHGQNLAHIVHYPNCIKLYVPTPHTDLVLILAKQPDIIINHNDPELLTKVVQFVRSQNQITPQIPDDFELQQIELIHNIYLNDYHH